MVTELKASLTAWLQEVAGSIRSVPSALHGSLTMGATLPCPQAHFATPELQCT